MISAQISRRFPGPVSIARTYGPVVARVIEPPCGPVDGLLSAYPRYSGTVRPASISSVMLRPRKKSFRSVYQRMRLPPRSVMLE